MKARMEKYEPKKQVRTRTTRNERLYDEVQNMNIDYVKINVDNAVDLSTPSTSSYREGYQKQRELDKIIPSHKQIEKEPIPEVIPKDDRIYDIDEILQMARDNKLFEEKEKKRLINTEYNILTKLDVGSLEADEMKKEDIKSLIDTIYEQEKPVEETPKTVKEEEKLLSDLLDDSSLNNENLQEELKLKEELNSNPINDTINKEEIKEQSKEKLSIEKEEQQEEMEDFGIEKEGKGLLIAIIVVIILILLTCGFFVYEYFFGL